MFRSSYERVDGGEQFGTVEGGRVAGARNRNNPKIRRCRRQCREAREDGIGSSHDAEGRDRRCGCREILCRNRDNRRTTLPPM